MALFPEVPAERRSVDDSELSEGERRVKKFRDDIGGQFPPGTPEYAAADIFIDLLRMGNTLVRAMMTRDRDLRRTADAELRQKLIDMGVSDEAHILGIQSVVTCLASQIPPGLFDED